ncbi:beta-galactosidase [Croceibacterium mercuriale]|uniref:Beta-galactosidase n=1 Tax=Croceibacterium mercuriale TaxID=1572751 RepID=A0A0B2BT99_9SPHN|nr:beta-galactosidase GalA [Croceibacterium mercuriale]KHL24758.1 beta-galactosidase [Croceibacterium mercuriale]
MRIGRRNLMAAGMVAGAVLPFAGLPTRAAAQTRRAPANPRSVTRLAEWRFHLGHAADMEADFGWGRNQRTFAKAGAATADAAQPGFDDSDWRQVRVPHDWAVELPFAPPAEPAPENTADAVAAHGFKAIGRAHPANSIGWYRIALPIEASDRDRAVWLEFDGVFRDATIFVNGYVVGTNESGYAPFGVSIGDFLDYDGGPNVLTVRVDATLGEGWFYEGAGIYRHVDLVRAAPVHVPQWGSYVRSVTEPAGARVTATLEVRNAGGEDATGVLRQHVAGPDGREAVRLPDQTLTIPAGDTISVEADAVLPAPRLWSPADPALYRLVSEVRVGDAVVDRYETPFGVRHIRFDAARGLLLNGQPAKLLGVCNHQDHAGVGTGIPDALHRWRIAQMQEMGCNAWRSAHNPPAAALLDAADQMGMMMIVEARRNSSDPVAMDELERIMRRDRNHPCVIAWSLGNEEPHQGTQRGARITAAMQDRVRGLDATRPSTFALDNSWDKGVATVVDVVGFNYRTDQMDAFHAAHPDVPVYGSETGSTVATRGAYANDPERQVLRAYDTEHPWWASTAEAWWRIGATRPWIAGGFIWTGFDYRGEPTPFPRFPSISSYFGVTDTCGFPKDNFYYYRAWWRPAEPLVHVLPHWNWPGREGENIEVWVHGNTPEVELFLNGDSLGRKPMPVDGHLAWQVPYEPGKLEARGMDGKLRTARDIVETADAAYRVELTADRRRLTATGDDVAVLRAEILDRRGRPVPDAGNLVRFIVQGRGQVIGVGNGNPTSVEADVASERHAFNGLCQAIVRVGNRPGTVVVRAEADGLQAGEVTLVVGPA